ncbi:MAG: VWA domain-containing protein, partial [Terrimicrobiaceae bacterium]|nr:VWA domain-containing protein [Terrimicrobiaceae bacterium]
METSSLTFARPAWLLALVLLPMVAALMVWSWSRGSSLVDRIVAPRLRPVLAGSASTALRALKAVLALAACALAVAAIAGPQLGYIEREVPQRGRDILLAIDTSRSMLATDLAPDRLTRAKLFAKDLLGLAAGDRLGLIAFAGSAFLQAPLTMDRGAVVASIEELDTSIIPKGGTNIAAAIRLAERAFGKGEAQSRALIILSDGEELDADGVRAAREAAALGIRIFTVGAATAEGSLIPIRTADGRNDFVRDPAGKPVNSRLDESRLKEIAEATGGFYTPLGPEAAARIMNEGIRNMQTEERGAFASRQP